MNIIEFFRNLNQKKMNKTELATLRISMLIAALDGDIDQSELETFRALSEKCDDYSPAEVDAAFRETLRSAGYLMLLARVADCETLLNNFLLEAEKMLPTLFDFGAGGINSAIALWTDMAKSDGDFAEIERQAIERLKILLETRCQVQASAAGMGAPGYCIPGA